LRPRSAKAATKFVQARPTSVNKPACRPMRWSRAPRSGENTTAPGDRRAHALHNQPEPACESGLLIGAPTSLAHTGDKFACCHDPGMSGSVAGVFGSKIFHYAEEGDRHPGGAGKVRKAGANGPPNARRELLCPTRIGRRPCHADVSSWRSIRNAKFTALQVVDGSPIWGALFIDLSRPSVPTLFCTGRCLRRDLYDPGDLLSETKARCLPTPCRWMPYRGRRSAGRRTFVVERNRRSGCPTELGMDPAEIAASQFHPGQCLPLTRRRCRRAAI